MAADSRSTGQEQGVRPPAVIIVALVGSLCAIYVVSQFLRNSVGVIAPDLRAELNLQPEALGLLSSAFFLSFAAAQIPLGVALDRYGPRLCMAASVGLAVIGCLMFAWGDDMADLTLARVLMGLGCSSFFMAPLAIYARWFSPERFSTLTGIQLGLGSLGTLFATAPLAMTVAAHGWRNAFVGVAVASALIGIVAILVARDAPPGASIPDGRHESLMQSLRGVADVARQKDFWPVFAMHLVGYASFATILGLWGGPYLTDIYGLDLTARGDALFIIAAAQIAALFVWGPMDRIVNTRKWLVVAGVVMSVSALLLLVFSDGGLGTIYVLFAFYGLACAYVPVLTAHGRALFPEHLVGRGITLLNMAVMGGVFLMQSVTGIVFGLFAGPGDAPGPAAYKAVFIFIALAQCLALAAYLNAKDRRPKA